MATLLQLCQPFDHAVMAVIQQLSGAMMDKIMLVFTFLGEETFAILLLIKRVTTSASGSMITQSIAMLTVSWAWLRLRLCWARILLLRSTR